MFQNAHILTYNSIQKDFFCFYANQTQFVNDIVETKFKFEHLIDSKTCIMLVEVARAL